MFYFTKTPFWLKKLYPTCLWNYPNIKGEKKIYLSFDDGHHSVATPFVLDLLKKYNAKATFFCIGKNVVQEPILFHRLLAEGHTVGNHTFNHLNGWKSPCENYIADMQKAQEIIPSKLFRPPYGRMTKKEEAEWLLLHSGAKIVMWSVLSGDFDKKISGEKCWENVRRHTVSGDIIVFHDSAKARERMEYTLPKTLQYFQERGFRFDVLPQ